MNFKYIRTCFADNANRVWFNDVLSAYVSYFSLLLIGQWVREISLATGSRFYWLERFANYTPTEISIVKK
jgi:hypothetical protein